MVNRLNNTAPAKLQTPAGNGPAKAPPNGAFSEVLAEKTRLQESLRVSSHAQKRLSSSEVTLTDSDVQRIGGAVARASEKGSNQSLIMLDKMALVVSIRNRVLITAVDTDRMKEGVFTNIDSVVIA